MTRPATSTRPRGTAERRAPHIAVLRALPGIGDLLCALPSLRAVRAAHPGAHVTLVGLPTATWFVERYPCLVDDLLVVEGVRGLPEVVPDPTAAARFVAAARARRFDLAIQLHGSGVVTNPLTTALGARHQVTAYLPGRPRPPGTSIAYPTREPEIRRLLAVTAAAGCPPVGEALDLPVTPAERATADALVRLAGPQPVAYACLHPGAARPANRWPPARFAAVGDHLAGAGLRVVITGTAGERGAVEAVARAMSAPAVDVAGATTVGTLAALFAQAAVVVSNDTGASHVAAAVGCPSVVVFPPGGDPDRWAPLDRERHRPVAPVDPPLDVTPSPSGDGPTAWPTTGAVLAAVAHLPCAVPGARAEDPA